MRKQKFLAIAAMSASVLLSNALQAQELNTQPNVEPISYEQSYQLQENNAKSDFTPEKISVSEQKDVPFFDSVQNSSTSKKAIIFVGGVNDTYHFWDKHIEQLKDKDVTVLGYEGIGGKGSHPHNIEYMENNAQHIADGIKVLQDKGFTDIELYAHSLGGVVTKRALHILDETNGINSSEHIKFTAVSSPLGGFAAAIPSHVTPFFKPIAKFFNIAMAGDMSPLSNFYSSITKSLPKNIDATVIESADDPVAQPTSFISRSKYEEIAQTFNNRVAVDGQHSHEFASEPKNLESQGVDIFQSKISKENILNNIKNIRENSLPKDSIENKIALK